MRRWGSRFQRLSLQSGRFAGHLFLSAYSPEELYVRKQLIEHTPDIVINVIDTSNLERNLYLTTQIDRYAHPHGLRPQYV